MIRIKIGLSAILLLLLACSPEKALIKKAREMNTIEGYKNYLAEYEEGRYTEEAVQKISGIRFAHRRDSAFVSLIQKLKTGVKPAGAVLRIQPSDKVLMGTPVSVKLDHLPPNTTATLHAYRRRWGGLVYSFATFQSDPQGHILLDQLPPVQGTYTIADSLGIFWSMSWPAQKDKEMPFVIRELKENTVCFNLEIDHEVVSAKTLELMEKLPNIVTEQIHTDSLTAVFHYPENQRNLPVLILVAGGSKEEFDWNHRMTQIIASNGYASLSLPYNHIKPLPEYLEKVPLEYFFHAVDWVRQQPVVDPQKIIIAGGSRGGELALLLGSMDPDIHGVVAISPSCVVWQGLPHNPFNLISPKAAWTFNGKDIPFMKHRIHWPTLWKIINGGGQIEMMYFHEKPLEDPSKIEQTRIRVENIMGPVLFIAGKDDRMWPSYAMCRMMQQRLDSLQFGYPVQELYYEHAGHRVIAPDLMPTIDYQYEGTKFGGTDSGNANAQIDAWKEMIGFLNTYFKEDGT